MRIVVDYLAEGEYNPTHQKLVHAEDVLRMLRELSHDERYLDMVQQLTKKDKEEGISMCELLDRYWNGGVAEGISIGVSQGLQQGLEVIAGLVRDNLLSLEEALKRINVPEEEFRKLL